MPDERGRCSLLLRMSPEMRDHMQASADRNRRALTAEIQAAMDAWLARPDLEDRIARLEALHATALKGEG